MSQLPFGGPHTEEKLQVLQNYLFAYQHALKNTGFTTIFFDAFAGTGDIPAKESGGFFEDVEEAEPFIEGSAKRALTVDPPFAKYVFVEKRKSKVAALTALKTEFPSLAPRICIQQADANAAVEVFCANTNWPKTRAVMFLDPFGNQVGWGTLEAIARTRAIDLWYLFPAGLGVNRQISATGGLDSHKAASLDFMLGTPDWRQEFISTIETRDLFGIRQENSTKQANVDSITRFMIRRMKAVFKGVVLDQWLPLGPGGSHWYSLLFACSNPSARATDIAKRVASAVMKRR